MKTPTASYFIVKPALASPTEMAVSSSPVDNSASSYQAEVGASSSLVEMSATLSPTELAAETVYPINQRYRTEQRYSSELPSDQRYPSELASSPSYPTELPSDFSHRIRAEKRYSADKIVEPTVVELAAIGSAPAPTQADSRAGPQKVLVTQLEDPFRINFGRSHWRCSE